MRSQRVNGVSAICWDWNGTLLDDVEICRTVMNRVLGEYGAPELVDTDAYRRSFRFPIRAFYSDLGIASGDFVAVADRYLVLLADAVGSATLQPAAKEVLQTQRARGITQVLASATLADALDAQLSPHGMHEHFDRVLSITDPYAASKVDVIAAWIGSSGFLPSEVLLIGDTNHDEEIARALGTGFVHFTRGHQLRLVDGTPEISSLSELLALI